MFPPLQQKRTWVCLSVLSSSSSPVWNLRGGAAFQNEWRELTRRLKMRKSKWNWPKDPEKSSSSLRFLFLVRGVLSGTSVSPSESAEKIIIIRFIIKCFKETQDRSDENSCFFHLLPVILKGNVYMETYHLCVFYSPYCDNNWSFTWCKFDATGWRFVL